MKTNDTKTIVIFRKFEEGDVIAIFPTELGNNSPYTCSSYMHVGQHATCSPHDLIQATKPANRKESRCLKKELIRIGYAMHVRHRMSYSYLQIRISKLNASRQPNPQ